MNCKVNVRDNGNIEVSGENAPLYYEALSVIGNESDALDIYGVSLTDGFKGLQLKADLSSVTAYIEGNNIEKATYFTPQEVVDIYNAPNYKQFIPSTTVQGKFSLNRENMLNFYSAKEADEILESPTLQRDVHNIWYKMQNSLGALEDISFRDPIVKVVEQEKTVLKKQRVQNIDETYTKVGELAANAKTKEELEEIAIKDDSEVATQVADNLDDVFEEFKDKKALQQYVENQLTGELEKKKYNSTEDRILSTYNVGQNSDSIQDSILLLLSLDEQVIAENKNDVTDLLKSVVEEASDLGLDLVGLETLENGAENTKTFLANLSAFLTNLSTMGQFIESYNTFFNIEEDINRPQIKRISQTNVFSVSSNKSELALFNDKSIVRIKGDVYKKVSRNSENLFEDLYLKALQDPTIFEESVYYPYAFDGGGNFLKERLKNKRYKTEIKENIRKEVENQSRQLQTQEGFSTESLLELTAHKIANKSENTVINKSDYYNFLGNTNEDTFIGNFLVKINKHLIKQKIKGNVLPLTFTQNGLELNYQGTYSAFEVVNGLPKGLQQDLITYSKITGNLENVLKVQPKYYVTNLELNDNFNRNFYSNFKDQLPAYEGQYSSVNKTLIKTNSQDKLIKVRNVLYENVAEGYYAKVESQNKRAWNRNKHSAAGVPNVRPDLTNTQEKNKFKPLKSSTPQEIKDVETAEQTFDKVKATNEVLFETEDLQGNILEVRQEEITTYDSSAGNIDYIINNKGEMVMIKGKTKIESQPQKSLSFKQYLSLPGVTQKEALNMFKNSLKSENYKIQNTLNC